MSKICYTYDIKSENIYTGTYETQESPREPGVYYLPANATWFPPLPEKEGHLVCFNTTSQSWEYLKDISKITYYDTRAGYRVEFPKREDLIYYTEQKPEYPDMYWNGKKWVVKIKELKEAILSDLDFYRNELEKDGFPIENYGVLDLNEKTHKALTDVLQDAFNRFVETITFRLKDNTFSEIPKEVAFLASLEMWRKLEEINREIWNLKDKLNEVNTFKELTSISFNNKTLIDYVSKYKKYYPEEEVTDANS